MTATATSNDPNITEKAIQALTINTHLFGIFRWRPSTRLDGKYSLIKITQYQGRGVPLRYISPLFPPVKGTATLDLLRCHLFIFFLFLLGDL